MRLATLLKTSALFLTSAGAMATPLRAYSDFLQLLGAPIGAFPGFKASAIAEQPQCYDTLGRRYTSSEGGYSIRFPMGTVPQTTYQDAAGGLRMVMTKAECGHRTHVAMFMRLPPDTLKSIPAQAILDGATQGALSKSGATELSRRDFFFGPQRHPARELVFEKDGTVGTTHIIIADPQVFVLVVGGSNGFGNSRVAMSFLNSFELAPAQEPGDSSH